MRVLAVGSLHASSTRDVWLKLIAGLRLNGIDVLPFDILPRFTLFSFLEKKMKRSKIAAPRDWSPMTLTYEVITGAAIYHGVDAVIVVSPQYFPNDIALMLRSVGIKTVAYFTECPYEDTIHTPITASNFDISLVSDRYSVGLFESFCPVVEYVPHCYDPDVHYPGSEEREDNVVFIGTGYGTRVQFMESVDWPRRLDLYGFWPKSWMKKHARGLFESFRRGEITNREETAAIYRKSAVSFSMHRQMRYVGSEEAIVDGEAYSLGPRNWELAACGVWQCSDLRQELVDVFGDSVPLYRTPREMGDLLRRAFDDPSWRADLVAQQMERAKPYSAENVMRPVAQLLAA